MFVSSLKLPDKLRRDYAISIGPVFSSLEEALSVLEARGLICVGDVVMNECLKFHKEVKNMVLVYDEKTMRKHIKPKSFNELNIKVLRAINPSGLLTVNAIEIVVAALREASYTYEAKIAVKIEGEEDLIALVALAYGPPGWYVAYGMPNVGVSVVPISPLTKSVAHNRILQLTPELTSC
ncbi:MAG: DUF359 domain-containing protein [Acidilobaceae archaeon]